MQVTISNQDSSHQAIISVRNLSKTYKGGVTAVNDVSFQVYEGEIFGFLGPNGAGKTTTISMLTTLTKPSTGDAEVAGVSVVRNPSEVRRAIGVVQQDNTSDLKISGYENLVLHASLQGIPRKVSQKRAVELLELVELTDAAKRKVQTYSGGMRRRLELACGLIHNPRILFLDEPTLGLDIQTRSAVWKYLRELQKTRSLTLFLTTHYLEEADDLCNRIAVIDHGKILTINSPTNLKTQLGGDAIELGVKGEHQDISTVIENLPLVRSVSREGSNYKIKAVDGEEAVLTVIDAVRSKDLHITRILVNKPSLNEVYLRLTGRAFREGNEVNDDADFLRKAFRRGG